MALLFEIRDLENSVVDRLMRREEEDAFQVNDRTVALKNDIVKSHKGLRISVWRFLYEASATSYLIAPLIYFMIFPAVIVDFSVSVYQMVCFPILGISKVNRSDYVVLDRRKLIYLNWIEKVNCDYCGYFNGVIAYTREIASRSEQYFCPIRHATKVKGLHERHARFLPFGEIEDFRARCMQLRKELRESDLEI